MPNHSKKSSPNDSILAHGGGNATAAGVEFQAKLGAWFASQLLAERPLDLRLTGKCISSLRFETEAPIDDILVQTDGGWIFVQAKTHITLSENSNSELAKTADQFVRQWLACSTGDGERGWNRPLQPDRDRFLLAIGPNTSRSLAIDLAQGLAARQAFGSAQLPKAQTTAVRKFDGLLERAWIAVTGQSPATKEILAISKLVTILTFDFDGADRMTTEEILLQVLDIPAQTGAAFSTIAQLCQELMRQRTGGDMPMLRSQLLAAGVQLAAPPSYRKDVARLREYSEHVRQQLNDYEVTRVAGQQVHIERECTNVVINAGRSGSLLLVGEPGAGKSAVINASAAKLKEEGHDVLELAVDRLPVRSLPDLAVELGLSHPLSDVLLNWPGDQPAFLFIDALDASRGGENEMVFRTLISNVLAFETRQWHVIASIRTFDLRLGEQFRRLFSGQAPNQEFADPAFPGVVHVHVPQWTPAEFEKLLQEAPNLATAINAGGERLRELALVPINTRLVSDLISGGLAPSAFGEINTQVQLLDLYWSNRVEKHGTGAELCVEAVVSRMIESRSLQARKLDSARPDAKAFDALLHENVLVPLRQEQFVAFRHHILFDYAASRVFFSHENPAKISELLTQGNGLGLMLAPALGYTLQQLWNDASRGHRLFWEAVTRLSGDSECDPVARSIASRIASEMPSVVGDAIGLLKGLSVPGESKARTVKALSHVVGALVVRFEEKQLVHSDPWCELAEHASEYVGDTVWSLRSLLYTLYERISSDAHRAQLGRAARKLLAYSLDPSNDLHRLTASAVDFVAETYASNIEDSRKLLRCLFEPTHFQKYADQEIPWLVRRLKPISEADPEFVVEIFSAVFAASIPDESRTSLGQSQILPLTSNRKQDYEIAWWSLCEFLPQFFEAHPLHAIKALIQAISGYVMRVHPISSDARAWNVQTPAGMVHLLEDNSFIWAWDVNAEHGDSAHDLAGAFVKYFEVAREDVARAMIQEIVQRNKFGLLWARTLLAASKRPEAVGDLLWPIATQEPFLTSLDTQKDAIDFIAARYPFENVTSRRTFEHAAIHFRFTGSAEPEKACQKFLETIFSCIGGQNLATDDALALLPKGNLATPSPSLNERPFAVVTKKGLLEKNWWLKHEGIDLNEPIVAKILTETDEIKKTLRLENGEDEIADIPAAIHLLNSLVDMTSEAQNLPKLVASYAYDIAAQGTAKLSHLPPERLLKKPHAMSFLVALVIRLAKTPAEPVNAETEAKFELSTGWGSPNARVSTAEAVMQLCRLGRDVIEKLHPTVELLLDTSNHPAVRMQIAEMLTVLWGSARPLMWELADRVALTEPNRGVLRFFVHYFLGHTIHADPDRVERLVAIVHGRNFNREDKATKLLSGEIGSLFALLWISHGRIEPQQMLKIWIADPHTFEAELSHAITTSGNALTIKYQKAGIEEAGISQRTQDFYAWATTAMAVGLERYLEQRSPTETERERGPLYDKILNQLCNQIYYASGANRSGKRNTTPLETDEAKRDFLFDMRSVLNRIAEAGTPGTIHHLIELLEFLVPADPGIVFDLVADALLGGGRRHGYQFESLGASRFVEIVGHYLADHRELFADERRRKRLIACLDTFMEAGWPAARRLLYRLPELLQ
jgi:hypothetical protein